MFSFIKQKLKKIYNNFTSKAAALFSRNTIDQDFLKELKELLICSDTGIKTTNKIMQHLTDTIKTKGLSTPQQIKQELESTLHEILTDKTKNNFSSAEKTKPPVLLLVGINGSGKTTFAAKFANKLKTEGKRVLLVAGDTFRAAATEQLSVWGNRINVETLIGKPNQDPASVVFDGCQKFSSENYDHLIIDTAGRLQTKVNLMKELEKIRKIISKKLPDTPIQTWLTIDAMLGQNSFEQAKLFHEATNLDGIILTKLDGTGKGGIVFSISNELHLPIIYVTFGEDISALKQFDPQKYIAELLG